MADKNLIFDIYNEDGTSFYGLSLKKSTYTSVVMSLDDKIEGDIYYKDNRLAFTFKEYIIYKGIKYYMKLDAPPTIVKKGMTDENSELKGMTKYSLTFYHPMVLLYNIPFTDVAVSDNELKYKSQDTTFYWIGTLTDMVGKINKNLQGTLWTCSLQPDFVDSGTQSDVIQFQDQKISDVLKTSYETWKIPYTIDGYNILFGKPSNEIYIEGTTTPYIFKLGQHLGLKNNDRTPKNNTIITRIAGYGSEENIPSGYPLIAWTGDQTWNYTINNDSEAINSYGIIDGVINGESVRIINHPFTRKNLMPSNYVDCVNKKVNPLAIGYDKDIELIDYYDAIDDASHTYINHINPLAPSYYKKGFDGADKSVNTIKPTIVGAKYNNQEIDIIKAISWINDDKTPATGIDDTYNTTTGKYTQGYFNIELYPLGFDLYAMAAATEAMSINMTSGACNGCKFELGVDWDVVKTNFYYTKTDGTIVFDPTNQLGAHRDYTLFPDSTDTSITVIVKKDTSTFGTLMPNVYQQPTIGDKLVFIGIAMPQSYINYAQTLLDEAMKQYMKENNFAYYEYPFDFDEHFLETNEYILNQIKTNCIVRFEYGADTLALSVKEYSITWGDKALPTYKITLTDDVTIVMNQIGAVADGLSKLGSQVAQLQTSYNINIIDELSKKVSKIDDDTVKGKITFLKGIISEAISKFNLGAEFGTFVSGLTGTGGYIDGNGNAELQSLILRAFLEVPELRYNRVTVQVGNRWRAAGGGVVESVNKLTDTTGEVTLHLVDGDYGKIAVGDICMGIYHDGMTTANNFGEDYDDRQGNFKFKGFFTAYFTVTEITETGSNSKFKYSLRDTNGNWKFAFHPCEAMQFVCYGNFTNTSRQACVYETLTYSRLLRNVNTWEFSRANIGLQYGDLTGLTNNGNNLNGYGLYAKDNIYFEGAVIQLSPEQISEIASEAGGYSAHVSKNSDTIDVDDNGYPTTSLVTSDSGVSTYRLRSTMNVNRGSDILLYSSTAGVAGTYSAILQCKGCTADIANGTVRILTITGLNGGTSSYDSDVMKALTECSVDIQINCEGEVILQQTYTVTINHVASYYKLDLTNENSSVNCDKDGKVIGTFEASQALIYKGASTDTGWTLAISDADGATASMADGLVTVSTVTKDITSIKIAATKTGFATLYATYTITKVYAGKDGTAAVSYSLVPSVSVVKVDKLAAYSASSVSCGLARTTGANREVLSAVPDGYTFKYSINNGTSFSSYTLGSSVDMTTVTTALVFELLDSNSKVVDIETIPLLKDGSDGKDYEYIYVRSTTETTPSTPATSQTDDYVPSGWTDDPSGVTATYKYEYISTRQKINGTWSAFSAPVIWARYAADGATGATGQTGATGATGAKGRGIDNVVKRYLATSASSGVTSSSGSWSYSMVSPTSTNKYLWCMTNTYYTDGTYDVDYEIIAVCGQDGNDGSSGSSGNNGCVIRTFENGFVSGQTYRNDTNYSTSGVRYLDFILVENSSYASGYKVYQTVTTHSYANGDESNSNYFTEVSTNAASAFFNYIVAKDASIKMLTGSFIGVKGSSGNIVAGLIGGNFPIFAGSSTPSSAPFRVGTDGSFYSNNATVTGTFTMYLNSYNFVNIEVKSRTFNSSSINTNIFSIADDTAAFFSTSSGTCLRLFSSNSNGYAIRSIGSVDLTNNNGGSVYINGLCLKEGNLSDGKYLTNDGDNYIYAGSSDITVNLPTSPHIGKIITIRKIGTGNITVKSNKSMYTSFRSPSSNNSVDIINGRTVIFRYWDIASCWTANYEENW